MIEFQEGQCATEPSAGFPKEWRRVRLREVCQLVGQTIDPLRYQDEVFAHYSIPAYDAGNRPVVENGRSILSSKVLFPNGAVLFSKINPRISRVWYVADEHTHRRICSTEYLPLLPGDDIDPEFLCFSLRQPGLKDRLQAKAAAATKSRARLRPDDLLDSRIPLPPVPEQRRIAALLTEQMAAVEQARAAAEQQKSLASDLPMLFLKSVFERAAAEQWPTRRIKDIAVTCSGTTPSRTRRDYYTGTVPWVKTGELRDDVLMDTEEHVSEQALRDTSLRLLPRDTLLVAMYGQGQTRGRTALLAVPATTNQACFAILPNPSEFHPQFLQDWFRFSYMKLREESEGRGGNQPNLNGEMLSELPVPLPSLSEQRRLADMLSKQLRGGSRLLAHLEAQLAHINSLPAALLVRAFSGNL